jgi:protein tyrosine phosphatase (PTP) superfamily phosphohydrolase (DUF442 family)
MSIKPIPTTFWSRLRALWSMYMVDHGFVRAIYNNFYRLSDGMYRCSQPNPFQFVRYQKKFGIKTVINLRGPNPYGSYPLEQEVCQKLGIVMIDLPVGSRRAPRREEILALNQYFAKLEYPALMHCKSGADRAGIGAALYRLMHLGHSIENAMGELHLKYGHINQSKTGVLDFFLASYQARNAREPIPFLEWVQHEYDHEKVEQEFQENGWASVLVDNVLRRE